MLLINNKEVEELFDMKSCLEALETGYDDLLKGDAVYRPRVDVWMPAERPDGYYRWGTMEGASRKIGVFAIRMKSDVVYWPDGVTEEKYCMQPGTYCGLVMVSACATASRSRSSTTACSSTCASARAPAPGRGTTPRPAPRARGGRRARGGGA